MSVADPTALPGIAATLRGMVIDMSHAAGTPHLGSSLSCVDIVTAAYWDALRIDPAQPDDPGRDRFILSKGHAATTLYAALAHRGFFPAALLETYNKDGSRLAEHPGPNCVPGVEAATGSLGHGLPIALGMALAGRIQGRSYRVYRAAERRRMQRGLRLGGGDVRPRPEARERLRHRRLQQVAGHRPQQRDAVARPAGDEMGGVRLGRARGRRPRPRARWRP